MCRISKIKEWKEQRALIFSTTDQDLAHPTCKSVNFIILVAARIMQEQPVCWLSLIIIRCIDLTSLLSYGLCGTLSLSLHLFSESEGYRTTCSLNNASLNQSEVRGPIPTYEYTKTPGKLCLPQVMNHKPAKEKENYYAAPKYPLVLFRPPFHHANCISTDAQRCAHRI